MSGLLTLPAGLLLVYAALHDLAARTVPNWLPVALLGLGVAARLLDHALLPGLLTAGAMFLFLFALWAAGAMGGGDVKLWAAAVLVVPPGWRPELTFLADTVLLGGVLAVLYLLLSFIVPRPAASRQGSCLRRALRAEQWRLGRRAPLPYACAIAGGALAALAPPTFQL